MRGTKFGMKAKFAGEMPDFGVDPLRRRAHSRQTSHEHKMEAMNIVFTDCPA
jgi:hypothetical protein